MTSLNQVKIFDNPHPRNENKINTWLEEQWRSDRCFRLVRIFGVGDGYGGKIVVHYIILKSKPKSDS
jgi:hypothetical protein